MTSSTSTSNKPIIAVDIDEVLCEFLKNLITHYNGSSYNHDPKCRFEEFTTFHFADTWNCTDDYSQKIVNEFFETDLFLEMKAVEGAREVLEQLKSKYELKIVTSRQLHLKKATEDFLERCYPGIFSDVLLGNHYGKEGQKRSKPEMMRLIGAEVLIDDSLQYALNCAENGLKAILFGNYPWNQEKTDILRSKGIRRVHTWSEVPQVLEEIMAEKKQE